MTQLERIEHRLEDIVLLLKTLINALAEDEEQPASTLEGTQVGQRDDTRSLG
jgi:hypothetical protein